MGRTRFAFAAHFNANIAIPVEREPRVTLTCASACRLSSSRCLCSLRLRRLKYDLGFLEGGVREGGHAPQILSVLKCYPCLTGMVSVPMVTRW